jgi:hypothetical protein
MDYFFDSRLTRHFEHGHELAVSNWNGFQEGSRSNKVVAVLRKLIFGVEEGGLQTGEGVVEYFQQRYVYLLHKGSAVGLHDVEEGVEQVLLDKCCQEVVMQVRKLLTVRDLCQVTQQDDDEFHHLHVRSQTILLWGFIVVCDVHYEYLETLVTHEGLLVILQTFSQLFLLGWQ